MRLLTFSLLLALAPAFTCNAQSTVGHSLNEDLIYRINFGSSEDVKVLLEKGADPSVKTSQGEPVLDVAMERNDAETVNMTLLLIAKGADLEATDKTGSTPLMNAIRYKLTPVVKALLTKGADYHSKTPEGLTILDYAKHFGNQDSVDVIQAYINKEIAYQAALRTPERFKEIVHQYAVDSCYYQYWNYFLSSRQDPARDDEIKKKVEGIRQSLYRSVNQIQQYYSASSVEALQKVSSAAVSEIFKGLDSMVSNRNRAESGVGKEQDAKDRCNKIVDDMQIDVTGTLRNGTTASDSSSSEQEAPSSPAAPPPLPLDPGAR